MDKTTPDTLAHWLDGLPDSVRQTRALAAGEPLFRQGQRATAIFLVVHGRVRLVRHLVDGTLVTVHTARAGDTLAEAAAFATHYHCDAIAAVPTGVIAYSADAAREALERDPGAALVLARLLADSVRDLRMRLALRTIRSARERVLTWLKLQPDDGSGSVSPQQPWTAVAAEIGLTHEALYRALAALEREGVIQRAGGTVRCCR